ncbi:hypothetical protein PG993_013457 [Apiospora rasikravindrae]|uniref:Dioxygenase n=1 Tax=Apiospora rasikravindrae TaxID=990691 RepID=A0ABR1RXP9_9PEZI
MAEIPPGPAFTKGLDFTSNKIGNDGASKADHAYEIAVDIIREKLPLMSELKALLTVNLGDERPLIVIDARSGDAKLLDETVDEPDNKVTIKPEYIVQFYMGNLEPRYGLFKDAFFHEASMPQGRIPDLEELKGDIREFGYGLAANALTPSQVGILRSALSQQAAGEVRAGVAARDGGPHAPNQRVWTLINKGDEFVDFLNHPLLDEVVPWFLGEHALLTSYTANVARPGNVPMQLHTDQVAIQPPQRGLAYGLNVMWYLVDVAPLDLFDLDGTVAAEAPAGSALVFESRLWHATGPNRETEGERPVVMMFFMRSFVRQQENNFLLLRPEVEAKLSERARRMLGFCTTGALGGVEGEVREGIYVKRVENPVGPLRDAGTV